MREFDCVAELLEENTQLAKQSIAYISEVILADIIVRHPCSLQHICLKSCEIRAAAPFGKLQCSVAGATFRGSFYKPAGETPDL